MHPELMTFSCAACGITLTVPRSMAGISGPCPSCTRVITAPDPSCSASYSASPASELQRSEPQSPRSSAHCPPPLPPQAPEHDPLGSRLQPADRAMRPPTDGPPKGGLFSRMGVWIFVLLLASPFLLFGGMLFDLNGMLGDKQAADEESEETALINMIDQIVHPGDPKWQQQAGAQGLESAILTEGHRLQLEDEPDPESETEEEEELVEQ